MKKTFSIKGMHCNSCAMLIEKVLENKVNHVSASFAKEQAEITSAKMTLRQVKDKLLAIDKQLFEV